MIVVGSGPAGSTAAYRLATAGARTLLLDRARFPRDKPCGGGLTGRALSELPVDVGPVVELDVARIRFRLRYGAAFERGGARTLMRMTRRSRLDHFLAERAAAAGAEFRDGVRVSDVAVDGDGVRVGGARAEVLVAADGANGICARALGLGGDFVRGVALEGNVPSGGAPAALAEIELGVVPGGYGWVFPKGDHANVGVGGWAAAGPALRRHLQELCAAHGLPFERVQGLRGHPLPMRRRGSPLAHGRALLVGDAAGVLDPLSGDGMYEAFLTARLAAEAALGHLAGDGGALARYEQRVLAALGRHLATGWNVKLALDRYPRATFAVTRLPFVWPLVEELLAGGLAHYDDSPGRGRVAIRLLEALGGTAAAARG